MREKNTKSFIEFEKRVSYTTILYHIDGNASSKTYRYSCGQLTRSGQEQPIHRFTLDAREKIRRNLDRCIFLNQSRACTFDSR